MENHNFPMENHHFPMEHHNFPMENHHFPIEIPWESQALHELLGRQLQIKGLAEHPRRIVQGAAEAGTSKQWDHSNRKMYNSNVYTKLVYKPNIYVNMRIIVWIYSL